MAFKKEQQFVLVVAVILLLVGIVSYSAFSAKTPEQPVRIMFDSIAGKVLFDHKTHTAGASYGISCADCHHMLEEGDTEAQACLECHELESEDEDVPKRSDAFHEQCGNCHQEIDAGPQFINEDCNKCHVRS
ncbi:cytochrome c3 family protein [Thermodesulfobacteriota bacterium]